MAPAAPLPPLDWSVPAIRAAHKGAPLYVLEVPMEIPGLVSGSPPAPPVQFHFLTRRAAEIAFGNLRGGAESWCGRFLEYPADQVGPALAAAVAIAFGGAHADDRTSRAPGTPLAVASDAPGAPRIDAPRASPDPLLGKVAP